MAVQEITFRFQATIRLEASEFFPDASADKPKYRHFDVSFSSPVAIGGQHHLGTLGIVLHTEEGREQEPLMHEWHSSGALQTEIQDRLGAVAQQLIGDKLWEDPLVKLSKSDLVSCWK